MQVIIDAAAAAAYVSCTIDEALRVCEKKSNTFLCVCLQLGLFSSTGFALA